MLGKKTGQANFFDSELFAKMILKEHPLALIEELVPFDFIEEAAAMLYDPGARPAKLPA